MKDAKVLLMVSTEEKARWKVWADAVGQNLSEWIRERCNGGPMETRPSVERVEKVIAKVEKTQRLVKQCMHGWVASDEQ